jgi:hypothetical protein
MERPICIRFSEFEERPNVVITATKKKTDSAIQDGYSGHFKLAKTAITMANIERFLLNIRMQAHDFIAR